MNEELTMNEEIKEEAEAPAETMADLEDHFDDANPWNRVTAYMEEGTVLPVRRRCQRRCNRNGRRITRIRTGI